MKRHGLRDFRLLILGLGGLCSIQGYAQRGTIPFKEERIALFEGYLNAWTSQPHEYASCDPKQVEALLASLPDAALVAKLERLWKGLQIEKAKKESDYTAGQLKQLEAPFE